MKPSVLPRSKKLGAPDASVRSSAVNRRRFLSGTLAALSMPLVVPAGALRGAESGAGGSGVAGPKIKLGLVGAGGRGLWIARLFQRHGGYVIHAVADYFPEVARAAGQALGVPEERCFSGLEGHRRLGGSGVEAVALETPPWFMPQQAKTAVEAGLHVYMAKPVAVDVPGCQIIEAAAQAARAKKRCFLVDYQMPTDPHNREVVRMIRGGEMGRIVALDSHYYSGLFADPPLGPTIEGRLRSLIWVNDIALGGGYHVNACIHAVDAALWVAGDDRRLVAATGFSRAARPDPHGDSHDVFWLMFEFADGLAWGHRGKHLDNQTGFDVGCEAQGETGFASVRYGGKAFLKARENAYEGEVQNLYEAGAERNIAKFHTQVTQGDLSHDTVRRSLDGALATILGREAARRRTRLTMEALLRENARLEVDLKGLKA